MFNPSTSTPPRVSVCSLKLLTIVSLFSIPFSRIVRRFAFRSLSFLRGFRDRRSRQQMILYTIHAILSNLFLHFFYSYYIYPLFVPCFCTFSTFLLVLCGTLFYIHSMRTLLTKRPHTTYIQFPLLFLHAQANMLDINFCPSVIRL